MRTDIVDLFRKFMLWTVFLILASLYQLAMHGQVKQKK